MRWIVLLWAALACGQMIDSGSPDDKHFVGGAAWTPETPGYEPLGVGPYDTLRYGVSGQSFSYSIPVVNGFWHVRLHLMENRSTNTGPNTRVFTVAINGQISPPLDLFVLAGSQKPYLLDLFAVVNNNKIDLIFRPTKGNAVVSGIEYSPLATSGLQPMPVMIEQIVADRMGYDGPMAIIVGPDNRLHQAIFVNGSVNIGTNPALIAFGFPSMRFSERLEWAGESRWTFPRARPNPQSGIAAWRNGVKLDQSQYAFSWSDPNQLPDALIVLGSEETDTIMADYVSGGIPVPP